MSESVPHDFNKCHCDQWGRCLVHCKTCTCVADAAAEADRLCGVIQSLAFSTATCEDRRGQG